jgi:glycosyltransferase involved in cell wall biosynthesis
MRIGLVSAEYPPDVGGVGDHTARLAAELAIRGHAVDVVTSAARARSVPPVPPPGSTRPVEPLRVVSRWDWRILGTIPRLASDRGWDVLHIQYQTGAYGLHPAINLLPFWLQRRALRRRPAILTTLHDLREPYIFPKAGPLRRLAVTRIARDSDLAVVVAVEDVTGLAGSLAAPGEGPGVNVRHVPLGNHFEGVAPSFDRAAWRSRLGLSPTSELVGHLGFVNRSKAVNELVRATGTLVQRGRDIHLLFIGEPLGTADPTNRVYLAEVRRLIEQLHLAPRVHWTGMQTPGEIGAWLRCLDVAALPFRDGASARRTSLIAAWSHGTPVVTTAPAYWPAWHEGDPPAATIGTAALSADTLAATLEALLNGPEQRRRLRDAGTRMARQFTWPSVVAQTLDVYAAASLRRMV